MNTQKKASEYSNEESPTEQLRIFWSGSSLMLRRVVSILERDLLPVLSIKSWSVLNLGEGFIIHDGNISGDLAHNFQLDFNVEHFGSTAEDIAKNLVKRMSSGLV